MKSVSTARCFRTSDPLAAHPVFCSERSARSCWILHAVKAPHWVTVTCCIFLIDGKVFIPWGGYSDPCMSEGLTEPGTGRGLTEPGSLCTEPPLPSDWPSFFLISFLSLALRFWNQIFTWKHRIRKSESKCTHGCSYSIMWRETSRAREAKGTLGHFRNIERCDENTK